MTDLGESFRSAPVSSKSGVTNFLSVKPAVCLPPRPRLTRRPAPSPGFANVTRQAPLQCFPLRIKK